MKRIIAMILVVASLVLTLVSCGAFSYADEDLSAYASLNDKSKFEELIKNIKIEEGDFTADPETRAKKVLDAIYEVLADTVTETKTEGTPDDRDLVYYCYYATADVDGETLVFFADKMKAASPSEIQLGAVFGDDELSAKIAGALVVDITGRAYATTTTSSTLAREGDIAFVTYTKTVGEVSTTYTNEMIKIGKTVAAGETAADFASYLAGQKLSTSITKFELGEGDAKTVYSDIKINWIFQRITSGEVKEGDTVHVTLVKEITDPADATKKKDVTEMKLITVGAKPAEGETATTVESFVSGLNIGTTKSNVTIGTETYKSIKVDHGINNKIQPITVTDITYDEKAEFSPVAVKKDDKKVDLKDKELTYYIFPVRFTDVPEFTAEVLIKNVLVDEETLTALDDEGKAKLTDEDAKSHIENLRENIYAMLFGEEFSGLDAEKDKDKIAERAELLKKFKSESLTIDDLADKIVRAYLDIRDAGIGLSNAKSEYNTADENLTKAKDELADIEEDIKKENEKETPDAEALADLTAKKTEAEKKVTDAEAALETKKTNKETAEKKVEEEKTERDNVIKKLLEIKEEGGEKVVGPQLVRGYQILVYDSLQDSFNENMRKAFAKEIYTLLTDKIVVSGYPTDAVDEVYDALINNYTFQFYNGTHGTGKDAVSNYLWADRSFDTFLIKTMQAENSSIATIEEAKKQIRSNAQAAVEPIIKLYVAAKAYGQVLTEDEFDDYKTKYLRENSGYDYLMYYYNNGAYPTDDEILYGKDYSHLRNAAQLDKLLDWFLEYEEKDDDSKDDKDNGYEFKYYDYKKGDKDIFDGSYVDGTPVSKEKAE